MDEVCNEYTCDNVAEFDSIYANGGKLCKNHAQLEVEEATRVHADKP